MRIGVIIPVINNNYLPGLLGCIERNKTTPDVILIVDNSKKESIVITTRLEQAIIYRPATPFGVNESWNYGISTLQDQVDLITVLNDDLLIEDFFFEKLARTAEKHQEAGVLCPATVSSAEGMKDAFAVGTGACSWMSKREGWAWTIRSSVAALIPPIPDSLKTFCGDDWYWHHCHALGRPWLRMLDNFCFHYVGQSVKLSGIKHTLRSEKELCLSYL